MDMVDKTVRLLIGKLLSIEFIYNDGFDVEYLLIRYIPMDGPGPMEREFIIPFDENNMARLENVWKGTGPKLVTVIRRGSNE